MDEVRVRRLGNKYIVNGRFKVIISEELLKRVFGD